MNVGYPENLKEALIMSLPNAATMVLGMVTLNLWIYGELNALNFMRVVPIMFVAAFCLDFFVVGPIVKNFVMRRNMWKYMPFIRVGIMAGILTFVAPILESGRIVSFAQYITALPRNYICALFLQIFVAMRLGRRVFAWYKLNHK